MKNINDLKSGDELNNAFLCEIFGCGPQGGMRRSHKTNTLVIVSNHLKSIYDDRWIGNILHYTGMGARGDQTLTFQQNKTLSESKSNGVKVHLFEVFKSKKYTYAGEVELAVDPYIEQQLDKEENERLVYVFPVKLIKEERVVSESNICSIYEQKMRKAKKLSDDELKQWAKRSNKKPGSFTQSSIRYERNVWVAEFAKHVAKGVCQLCLSPAPFYNAKGVPYLETHHIIWLSKDGDDTIENTVALCPNCHKKMHIVDAEEDKRKLRQRVIELLDENTHVA
ncbi:HNH endonuclease [Xenorhabdus hominickii]|uniref:Restriction endonuclease n=1 Tax=Xenorhabdus hominickii TaxID=351679 RepID=A0A2G0QG30_XENHO|nr:HNH endonuclease [Xenorhabdus hominickii]AOM42192.1 restriction endonuclease [Xenorhabdus hominickii]PHM58193.1 restriction endonuclease [Xenorhabdus hominickii]